MNMFFKIEGVDFSLGLFNFRNDIHGIAVGYGGRPGLIFRHQWHNIPTMKGRLIKHLKVKKVKIGIKGAKTALEEFVQAGESIGRGESVKPEKGVYFESLSGFRKALTPKRLELLHVIKGRHPKSLQELSRFTRRNMKNIVTDVALLESLGLIDLRRTKKGRREAAPRVSYSRINLEIAV